MLSQGIHTVLSLRNFATGVCPGRPSNRSRNVSFCGLDAEDALFIRVGILVAEGRPGRKCLLGSLLQARGAEVRRTGVTCNCFGDIVDFESEERVACRDW